ncbi:MAG: amidohydrolase family protein, partial [Rhodobacteraceae bacterium]|nr:amidohydrolase family protein [Paracoccaceae bacterium]
DTVIVEAGGLYALPGLCDAHMHIESGMLTPARFAEAVIPHGTTTMFVDPHEIANVLGLAGVRLMNDEARQQPVNIFVQIPSCIPSAPGLETPGADLGPSEVAEALKWPNIIGLGEMMNYPGAAAGDPRMLEEMSLTMAAGKTVGGHYASPDVDDGFHAYVASGPADDHESTRESDAIARVRQGMRVMLRLGSAWHDVESQITAVVEKNLDPRNFLLCTDDCNANTLVFDGHMDRVVRHAIACGCDPVVALQMATINTATHFGLERELGSIAPGRRADLILTDDLATLPILEVYARGRHVASRGAMTIETPMINWPDDARHSVRTGRRLDKSDFVITVDKSPKDNLITANVIGILENLAPTRHLRFEMPVVDGVVSIDVEQGISQVALVERHRETGRVVHGFVHGFGYRGSMALASTIAHDCHHMIIVGTSHAEMAMAANHLAEIDGGISLWQDGYEQATVHLPIAGLMSDSPAVSVANELENLTRAMQACGCSLNNAYMQHTLLALAVIPELRISDLGLVDVNTFSLTEVFV